MTIEAPVNTAQRQLELELAFIRLTRLSIKRTIISEYGHVIMPALGFGQVKIYPSYPILGTMVGYEAMSQTMVMFVAKTQKAAGE